MSSLIKSSFLGNSIRFKQKDGRLWVSLTDMAKACGKNVNDWTKTASSKELISELESVTNIFVTDTIQGGVAQNQGTWAIEEVAIEFAGWCNVKFKIWTIQQIKTLLSEGKVEINPQLSLPPADVRVKDLVFSLEKLGIQLDNPRFKQSLQDITLNILGINQQALPIPEIWTGSSERAIELGYSPQTVNKLRVGLGKFLAKKNLEKKRENRLCNGTFRSVNLYLVTSDLDKYIREYIDFKIS